MNKVCSILDAQADLDRARRMEMAERLRGFADDIEEDEHAVGVVLMVDRGREGHDWHINGPTPLVRLVGMMEMVKTRILRETFDAADAC